MFEQIKASTPEMKEDQKRAALEKDEAARQNAEAGLDGKDKKKRRGSIEEEMMEDEEMFQLLSLFGRFSSLVERLDDEMYKCLQFTTKTYDLQTVEDMIH